jgi:ACS family hexuronate transporter-like MFS transporter
LGLAWTAWWIRDYFPAATHCKLSAEERHEIEEVFSEPATTGAGLSWLRLFSFVEVWGLVLAKFLSDAAWYFYLFWLPKYLYDVRGFDTKQVGYYAWIPYAAAGVGCLVGGWFSGWLIGLGRSLNFARKAALGASAAVMPLIIFVPHTPVQLAIVIFSVAFFGQQSWSTLVMIVPADLFPRGVVASVAGLVGFGGSMGGVVFGLVVGYLLDHGFGYATVFGLVSTLHVAAFCLILLTVRQVQPLVVPRTTIFPHARIS